MRVHFFLFKSEKKTDEGQLKQMRQVLENLFFFFFGLTKKIFFIQSETYLDRRKKITKIV